MDMDDFTPAGAGSLRDFPTYGTREPLGTFTDTRFAHPDEIWHLIGGKLDSRAPSLSSDDQGETRQCDARQQGEAGPGRPGNGADDGFDLHATCRMIRSAVRPGG